MTSSHTNHNNTASAASSSAALMIAASAMSGAAIAAAAIHLASRGRSSGIIAQRLQILENSLRDNRQDIVREFNHGLAQATTHFQKSLQSQEVVIQKSLQPVAAAQQQLSHINRDVGAIKTIFNSPKTRGNFGEFQLETLIQNAMTTTQYEFQYTLSNKKRVDCILNLPSPIGKLAIDSKFPLDAFVQLSMSGDDKESSATATAKIQESLSKHIHDVASKYILPGETADYAIMFLPSEALFLKIVDEHPEILLQANQKRVYIACPTTLMALLAQLHGASRGMALQKQTEEMASHVQKLMEDVDRLLERFGQAEKSLEKSKQELAKMQTSIGKIRRHKADLDALGCFATRAQLGSRSSRSGLTAANQMMKETPSTKASQALNGEVGLERENVRSVAQ